MGVARDVGGVRHEAIRCLGVSLLGKGGAGAKSSGKPRRVREAQARSNQG